MPSRSQANSSTGPERAAAIESRTRMNGFSARPAANAGKSEPPRCPTGNLLEGPLVYGKITQQAPARAGSSPRLRARRSHGGLEIVTVERAGPWQKLPRLAEAPWATRA